MGLIRRFENTSCENHMMPVTPFFIATVVIAAFLGGYAGTWLGKQLSKQRARNMGGRLSESRKEKILT
jgi:hypothetical protein